MNQSEMLASYRGDPMLMGIGASLLCIGLVAIASASIEYGDFHFGNPWHHTTRHALYLALGIAAEHRPWINRPVVAAQGPIQHQLLAWETAITQQLGQ